MQKEIVVPTLDWPLDLVIKSDRAKDAAVLNPQGRPGGLCGSLRASKVGDGGFSIALLVILVFCGD